MLGAKQKNTERKKTLLIFLWSKTKIESFLKIRVVLCEQENQVCKLFSQHEH